MNKGYLWKGKIGGGDDYEYYVVKDMAVNEDTELFPAYLDGNIWIVTPSPIKFTDFNVLEENLIVKRVDYNKKIHIPVDITGYGIVLSKDTVGSVLTLTAEELLKLVGNEPHCMTFGSPDANMQGVLAYAKFTPSDAFYNNGQGRGVYPAEGPVTIDFGEAWLGLISEHPGESALTSLNTYAGTKCRVE